MVKKIILFIFLLFLITSSARADFDPFDVENPPGGGCDDPDGDPTCDDPYIPLDDGVTYLLVAGVIYGVTRLSKNLKVHLATD